MNHRILLSLALTLLVAAGGCRKPEEIANYKVPKSRSGLQDLQATPASAAGGSTASQAQTETRMFVGISQRDDATWFFKITGPSESVDGLESEWMPFVKAIKFSDEGKPTWELPEGWTEKPGNQFRHATLSFGADSTPLDLAISRLGPNQDLLANVNRWRGQLGLANTDEKEMLIRLKKGNFDGGEMLLFDEQGAMSGGGGMGRAPFANAPFAGGAAAPNGAGGANNSSLTFDTPEGWTAGKTSSIVQVRLLKKVDDKSAQISVVEMPASANEWAPNAKRWAGEVGLTLSPDELSQATKEVSVDGIDGNQLTLIDEKQQKGSVAIMVKQGTSAWFLKLFGDRQVVANSMEDFDQFVKSFRLPK